MSALSNTGSQHCLSISSKYTPGDVASLSLELCLEKNSKFKEIIISGGLTLDDSRNSSETKNFNLQTQLSVCQDRTYTPVLGLGSAGGCSVVAEAGRRVHVHGSEEPQDSVLSHNESIIHWLR